MQRGGSLGSKWMSERLARRRGVSALDDRIIDTQYKSLTFQPIIVHCFQGIS